MIPDYGGILYDRTFNNYFHEKLYQELQGFEFLEQRRWHRKLCLFFQKRDFSKYPFELIPTARQVYMTRHKSSVVLFNVKHDYFKNYFFPSNFTQ